ncbi:MAG: chemotaxis protein CheD [Bacilli bacterium]
MIHLVGMADLKIATEENELRTFGLGSCVGLALYDAHARVAGLAHIMLPSSPGAAAPLHVAKYVNTAVPRLACLLIEQGAAKRRLCAKLAGGAQMFAASGIDLIRVGPRNVEAAQEALRTLGIPLVAADVGGRYGRTVTLECLTGKLWIRSVQCGEHCI